MYPTNWTFEKHRRSVPGLGLSSSSSRPLALLFRFGWTTRLGALGGALPHGKLWLSWRCGRSSIGLFDMASLELMNPASECFFVSCPYIYILFERIHCGDSHLKTWALSIIVDLYSSFARDLASDWAGGAAEVSYVLFTTKWPQFSFQDFWNSEM